ncbi:GNAT family N-acetyltransferase [Kiritimatiellota bacterium B12222]|nr:GNAT family N-acetyltransferase [Kiritimatiellota bacterium B12222]
MIRNYQHGDHHAIASIFSKAIHEIACDVYTLEQCNAWSEKKPNPEHWEKRCAKKNPFVFIKDERVVGFLELDSDGHIDCLYVHPQETRKGIASALIDHAVKASMKLGLTRVFVEASICAKPVFEKKGFIVTREQQVSLRGETLINYMMENTKLSPALS